MNEFDEVVKNTDDYKYPQSGNSPTKEHILSVLQSEIDEIQSRQTRYGWTNWALLGGIAGALWLLTDELKSGNYDLKSIGFLYIIFSLFVDLARTVPISLSPPFSARSREPRFYLNTDLYSSRVHMLAESIRAGLLIVIAITVSSSVIKLGLIFCCLTYLLFLLGGVSVFLTSFIKGKTYPTELDRRGTIIASAYSILLSIAFACYVYSLMGFLIRPSISDYRIGGLLAVISYLAMMLIRESSNSPILPSLIEIRRDLAFGRMDINTAIDQADIALSGAKVSNVLQEDVSLILDLFNKMNEQTNNAIIQLENIESNLAQQTEDNEFLIKKANLMQASWASFNLLIKERNQIDAEVKRQIEAFKKKAKWMWGISPNSLNFIRQVAYNIDAAMNNSNQKHQELWNKQVELAKKINQQNINTPETS